MYLLIFVFVNFICLSSGQEKVSYNGYSVLRITPTTQEQLKFMLNLTAQNFEPLEFWLRTTAVNISADVMVGPPGTGRLVKELKVRQIPYKVLIPDIGKVISDDLVYLNNFTKEPGFFDNYNSVSQINQFLQSLASDFPDIASLINIGISYEGRQLQLLKISTAAESSKSAIWIQGGMHAREQIGPMSVVYLASKIVGSYFEDEEVFKLVNNFDWYILPIANPDGYDYCQRTDRLWRKTRSIYSNTKNCSGVDPNRNWDIKWNGASGSSSDPCSEVYAGPEVFSEPETRAISRFMLENLQGRLEMFLDFHAYSMRWLSPYGYTSKLPPNYEQQKRLAQKAADALHQINGMKYSVGSTGNIMYTVTGGARDWVYDVIGATYSYVVELRDDGQFGFLLPRRQILPTAEETWVAVKTMGLELCRSISDSTDKEYESS